VLAACGLISLQDWQEKLTKDHENAKWIAAELAATKGVVINPEHVETNIIRFKFESALLKKLKLDYNGVKDKLKQDAKVLVGAGFHNDLIRVIAHRDTDRTDCEKLVAGIRNVLNV
jgi:threonine aldolase